MAVQAPTKRSSCRKEKNEPEGVYLGGVFAARGGGFSRWRFFAITGLYSDVCCGQTVPDIPNAETFREPESKYDKEVENKRSHVKAEDYMSTQGRLVLGA
ncbi:hypothetical protein VTK56DRAFT_7599 [Thermocarpiscus australiensis]